MNVYKQLRKNKKITQVELSKILNVQQTTVSKWEVGRAVPDYPTLSKIAEFYGVTTDYLLGLENKSGETKLAVTPNSVYEQPTAEEWHLLKQLREFDEFDRELVVSQIETLSKKYKSKKRNIEN